MRLEKIKLSGFKSFVDPTTVDFPGSLTAVVGPNGCGKSNIIDAIRWVMGESSAKNLRGESLADVIFNGATDRKPVGQAMIELIFDNSDATIGGEYASYSQLAIKRTVDRDSQSTYYLNGSRCRRKDIVDVFLGTGLGPRSYSIIEQGMISRFVEANPQELRACFEEAAGVSKYKERRRETENRIKHTLENLSRVSDISSELGQQLERLEKQAEDAKQYQILREQERACKAQLLALRWRKLDNQVQSKQKKITQDTTAQEKLLAQQRNFENQLEKTNKEQVTADEKVSSIQQQYHALDKDLARLEEAIRSAKSRHQQLTVDTARVQSDLEQAQEHIKTNQEQLVTQQQSIGELKQNHQLATKTLSDLTTKLNQAMQDKQAWQQRWDEYTVQAAFAAKQAHVDQTRIQHIEQQLISLKQRIEKRHTEQTSIDIAQVQQAVTTLSSKTQQLADEQQQTYQHLDELNANLQQQRQLVTSSEAAFDECKRVLQEMTAEKTSLEAHQKAMLLRQDNPATGWLEEQQLHNQLKIAQAIRVQSGWEVAVETVLANYLQAVVVDDWQSLQQSLAQLNQGELTLVTRQTQASSPKTSRYPNLLQYVETDLPLLRHYLATIYPVDHLDESLARLHELTADESMITRDGIWVNCHWVRIDKGQAKTSGVLKREAKLRELVDKLKIKQREYQACEHTLQQARERLQQVEMAREQQQKLANDVHKRYSAEKASQRIQQDLLANKQARIKQIEIELNELHTEQKRQAGELEQVRQAWQEALQTMEQDNALKQRLLTDKEEIELIFTASQREQQSQNEQVHQLSVQLHTLQGQHEALEKSQQREQQRVDELQIRYQTLQQTSLDSVQPINTLEEELQTKLSEHVALQKIRASAQEERQAINNTIQSIETQLKETLTAINQAQLALEQMRMQQQELRIRATTVCESLAELDLTMDEVLSELPEEAKESSWEQRLREMTRTIEALGPINLAAIDECSAAKERKTYLDEQHNDLTTALEMLQQAIAKIDRESRQRFRETYEATKENFSHLFPRLFGGGKATLELTENDWLNAGITVMAQPPGKKNSSIHLLSGGEKALTAVALVFAIFQLNPSPFCLLDEVDAPLDDANVSRFCQLVKEMSARVQFIIITHNKVTMELAEQLIGVTMREPGVSRIVSVDMQAALSFVERKEAIA